MNPAADGVHAVDVFQFWPQGKYAYRDAEDQQIEDLWDYLHWLSDNNPARCVFRVEREDGGARCYDGAGNLVFAIEPNQSIS